MIVCGVILVLLAILCLKFRNYKKEAFAGLSKKGNELKKLYPAACGIVMILNKYGLSFSNQERKRKMERLNVIKDEKDTELIFNIRRFSYSIAVIGITSALAFLYCASREDVGLIKNYQVNRPMYAEDKKRFRFGQTEKKFRWRFIRENIPWKKYRKIIKELMKCCCSR